VGLDLAQEARAVQLALQQVGEIRLEMIFDLLTHRRPDIGGGGRLESAALVVAQHLEGVEAQGASLRLAAAAAGAEDPSQRRAEILCLGAHFGQALNTLEELGAVAHQLQQSQLIVTEHGRRRSALRQTSERLEHQGVGRAAPPFVKRETVE
jgi:hypothetical protein